MIPTPVRAALTILFLLLCSHSSLRAQTPPKASDSDISAIRRVVAGYSDTFNSHDAHAAAALFAEDADFTNMRGANRHGQKEIEQILTTLHAGILKSAHRTDTVKNVRFLTPEIAVVDDLWEMTGAKAPDGSDNADRKGLFAWVVTKMNGKWLITVFHEVEFPK